MCSQGLKLAMKHLNVLTLNFTNVVPTFDQNEKLRTEHGERGNNVYGVLTIRTLKRR